MFGTFKLVVHYDATGIFLLIYGRTKDVPPVFYFLVFRFMASVFFFLMGDGLLKIQRMGTSPFYSPKVSAHKKVSPVV